MTDDWSHLRHHRHRRHHQQRLRHFFRYAPILHFQSHSHSGKGGGVVVCQSEMQEEGWRGLLGHYFLSVWQSVEPLTLIVGRWNVSVVTVHPITPDAAAAAVGVESRRMGIIPDSARTDPIQLIFQTIDVFIEVDHAVDVCRRRRRRRRRSRRGRRQPGCAVAGLHFVPAKQLLFANSWLDRSSTNNEVIFSPLTSATRPYLETEAQA